MILGMSLASSNVIGNEQKMAAFKLEHESLKRTRAREVKRTRAWVEALPPPGKYFRDKDFMGLIAASNITPHDTCILEYLPNR